MRKYYYCFITLIVLFSCKQQQREIARLTSELDSLMAVTTEKDSIQREFENYMGIIASTIDSIRTQESILTLTKDENGNPFSRKQIRENLLLLENVINRQRERIEELETQLALKGQDSTSYYRQLILYLYDQIEEKNSQIESLKQEMSRKDRHIAALDSQVSVLKQDVMELERQNLDRDETILAQNAALQAQDEQINTGHILIASRKQLQELDVIGKGLTSRKKINYVNLDDSIFTTVNLRSIQEIQLESKSPKILTAHPSDSYDIVRKDQTHSVLVITDPGRFWSLTVYLIIQL